MYIYTLEKRIFEIVYASLNGSRYKNTAPYCFFREDDIVVQVSQDEADYIRKHFSGTTISRTMRDKSKRGKYYAPESAEVMAYLKNVRKQNVVAHLERM